MATFTTLRRQPFLILFLIYRLIHEFDGWIEIFRSFTRTAQIGRLLSRVV